MFKVALVIIRSPYNCISMVVGLTSGIFVIQTFLVLQNPR